MQPEGRRLQVMAADNLMSIGGIMAAAALKSPITAYGRLKARLKSLELCRGAVHRQTVSLHEKDILGGVDCVLDWHPMAYSKAGYNKNFTYFNYQPLGSST